MNDYWLPMRLIKATFLKASELPCALCNEKAAGILGCFFFMAPGGKYKALLFGVCDSCYSAFAKKEELICMIRDVLPRVGVAEV